MRENGHEAQKHIKATKGSLAPQITGIVSTVMRPLALKRLVDSWKRHCPRSPLLIVDQSESHYTRGMVLLPPLAAIETKHDIGGCQGYQLALERVQTPFYALLDDDFVLTKRSDLTLLALMVRDNPYSLVGGALLREGGEPEEHRGNFTWPAPDHLHVEPVPWDDVRAIAQYDIIPNFYVADTNDVLHGMGGWDCSRKLVDHLGFYLRMKKAGLRVGYLPAASVNHMQAQARLESGGGEYAAFYRRRRGNARRAFLKQHGLRLVTGIEQVERT